MENGKYLNEEKYQKSKKKVIMIALIILIGGILIGGGLIAKGLINKNKVDSTYSESNKQDKITKLQNDIDNEEQSLKAQKEELINKGVKYDIFTNYTDEEAYALKILTEVLDPSFNRCSFNEYANNDLTKKYCSLNKELEKAELMDVDFEKSFNASSSIPYFIIGGFIIIASVMISGSIYFFAKRREILAFSTQQVMPVAQEGIEKMAPTIGKAAGEISKGITKGIKEGLKDDEN